MMRRLIQFVILAALMYIAPVTIARITYKPGPPQLFPISRSEKTDALAVLQGFRLSVREWSSANQGERGEFTEISTARMPFPVRAGYAINVPSAGSKERALFVVHGKRAAVCLFRENRVVVQLVRLPLHGIMQGAFSYENGGEFYLVVHTQPLSPLLRNAPCVERFRISRTRADVLIFTPAGEGIPAKMDMTSLSTADFDGDQMREMVVRLPNGSYAYEWQGDRLRRKWRDPIPQGDLGSAYASTGVVGHGTTIVATLTSDRDGMRIRLNSRQHGRWRMLAESGRVPRGKLAWMVRESDIPASVLILSPSAGGSEELIRYPYVLSAAKGRAQFGKPIRLAKMPSEARMTVGAFRNRSGRLVVYTDGTNLRLVTQPVYMALVE